MIGPGASTAWYVQVIAQRRVCGAGARSLCKGLPPDVTASPLTIGPTMTQGVIVRDGRPDRDAGCGNSWNW